MEHRKPRGLRPSIMWVMTKAAPQRCLGSRLKDRPPTQDLGTRPPPSKAASGLIEVAGAAAPRPN